MELDTRLATVDGDINAIAAFESIKKFLSTERRPYITRRLLSEEEEQESIMDQCEAEYLSPDRHYDD